MNKNVTENRKFLINRIGYIRAKAGLSARELSARIGKSKAYIAKFDNGDLNIPTEVLLDAIEACDSTPEEFFYNDINNYSRDKEILKMMQSLTKEEIELLINLLRRKG